MELNLLMFTGLLIRNDDKFVEFFNYQNRVDTICIYNNNNIICSMICFVSGTSYSLTYIAVICYSSERNNLLTRELNDLRNTLKLYRFFTSHVLIMGELLMSASGWCGVRFPPLKPPLVYDLRAVSFMILFSIFT